jgi:hypothetical protein
MVIFLHDKPVVLTSQNGRKCPINIKFTSCGAYHDVIKFLDDLKVDDNSSDYDIVDEKCDDYYGIQFNSQILDMHKDKLSYMGEKVTIVGKIDRSFYSDDYVTINYKGSNIDVPIIGLKIKVNIV